MAATRPVLAARARNTSTATAGSLRPTIGDGTNNPLAIAVMRDRQFQAPKRLSKALDGTVGAAPVSTAGALPAFFSGSASCFDEEGLAAAALAVLVSAGGDADFARDAPAALCPIFAAEAAGFDLGAEASAGCVAREAAPWSSVLEPNKLLKKLPDPLELPGTAEATCTDERGA